jgi:hypothetical protein
MNCKSVKSLKLFYIAFIYLYIYIHTHLYLTR